MVMTVTVEPGFASFSLKACSNAFKSSGLKIAGKAERFTVPSGVMASGPDIACVGNLLGKYNDV